MAWEDSVIPADRDVISAWFEEMRDSHDYMNSYLHNLTKQSSVRRQSNGRE